MKKMEVLTRLWDATCYHVLAQPGRAEAKAVIEMLQKTLEIFSVFHHSLENHFAKVQGHGLNIPAMQQFRDELLQSRTAVSNFLEEEARKIGDILNRQAEYMFILDTSQEKAKQEFILHTYETLAQGTQSPRKLRSILDLYRAASYEENARAAVFAKNQFERWCAGYSVRSHHFFLQIYSHRWKQNYQYFAGYRRHHEKEQAHDQRSPPIADSNININSHFMEIQQPLQGEERNQSRSSSKESLRLSQRDVFIDEEYLAQDQAAGEKDLIQEIFNQIQMGNMAG